jgi:uncharacterized protein
MAAKTDSVDLGRLGLSPGEARRLDLEVRPGGLQYGGERYSPATEWIPARLEVSRTAVGYALRLRIKTPIHGTCVRCLDEAELEVEVDAREIHQLPSGAEELRSPYVDEGDELDLAAWAHDALALAMPERFLCRPDCAGLCPVCGISLNGVEPGEHVHESEPDPRWARLRELRTD